MITWGQLAKSQTDPEKIEEAIARMIKQHNEDPEAHLCPGGSLQSHKMAEIIDHLARSIVADKIREWEAVKLRGSFERVDFSWLTIFESIDGYVSEGYEEYGGAVLEPWGAVRIYTGPVSGSFWFLARDLLYAPIILTFDKKRRFKTRIYVNSAAAQEHWVIIGNEEENHFGFKIDNNQLYGVAGKIYGGSSSVLLLTFTTASGFDLEARFEPGVKCEFFVDGVKKGEITENLPEGVDNASRLLFIRVETRENQNKYICVSYWDFWQEA